MNMLPDKIVNPNIVASRPTIRGLSILYSVGTVLSYEVAHEYFERYHYVWCCPYFSAPRDSFLKMPRSSVPAEIYRELLKDVQGTDMHSTKIDAIRIGLTRGANQKFEAGVISVEKRDEVLQVINRAPIELFRPLLYVIPYANVVDIIQEVSIDKRAAVMSQEYLIPQLHEDHFDVMELEVAQ